MLTQTTEYALQALSCLARAPGEWQDVRKVSGSLGIPSNYLSKILGQLARLGVVESRKGWGGGFRLRGDPSRVKLAEVIRPLEGIHHPRACVFGLPKCSEDDPCPLHDYWKRITEVHESMLEELTIADLAIDPAKRGRTGNDSRRAPRARASGVRRRLRGKKSGRRSG